MSVGGGAVSRGGGSWSLVGPGACRLPVSCDFLVSARPRLMHRNPLNLQSALAEVRILLTAYYAGFLSQFTILTNISHI